MFPSGFFVVHDPTGGSQHYIPELPRWKKAIRPLFNISDFDIKSWRDHTTFVESPSKIHYDLTRPVVIDDFKFTDITMLHHDSKESDDHLRARAD